MGDPVLARAGMHGRLQVARTAESGSFVRDDMAEMVDTMPVDLSSNAGPSAAPDAEAESAAALALREFVQRVQEIPGVLSVVSMKGGEHADVRVHVPSRRDPAGVAVRALEDEIETTYPGAGLDVWLSEGPVSATRARRP